MFKNAPACYRDPRWSDLELCHAKYRKNNSSTRNSGIPRKYTPNTPKIPKTPRNTANACFGYFSGVFGVASWGSTISGQGAVSFGIFRGNSGSGLLGSL